MEKDVGIGISMFVFALILLMGIVSVVETILILKSAYIPPLYYYPIIILGTILCIASFLIVRKL
jgi:hypothetical protein